ncbi:hypothetical protein GWI33_005434 [Rhynchophorus ferrugineus]|uniref:Uncharacterized protein n=1 Tax=Rhynchophorus ferrugineus TaxID=354439 RepID=A0A834MDU5_RHYFE|nr:hypothetical protein GWI33_005434 [Rhynchophorus ferrugineus]
MRVILPTAGSPDGGDMCRVTGRRYGRYDVSRTNQNDGYVIEISSTLLSDFLPRDNVHIGVIHKNSRQS